MKILKTSFIFWSEIKLSFILYNIIAISIWLKKSSMDTRDKTIPFEAPASNEKDYNLLAKIGKLYHVLYPHSMRKNVHLPAIIGNLYS